MINIYIAFIVHAATIGGTNQLINKSILLKNSELSYNIVVML